MAGAPTHYLRGNASEWTPRRVVFLDTETYPVREGAREVLQMRLWCAGSVDRRPVGPVVRGVQSGHGADRRSLARWLDAQTVGYQTTWVYAHNLGFDLTVSRLPDFLHRLGWRMTSWRFGGRNVTGRMRKGSKTLTLADSASLLPYSLERIGGWVGLDKLPMPDTGQPEEDWLAYCSRDVEVMSRAILTLMGWWDDLRLGHWTTSGPGCGWNSLRHLSPEHFMLIKTEPEGVAADRAAIRGGRRDVTRVGEIPGGPFALVDFSNAYLTVAAHLLLPKARLAHRDRFELDDPMIDGNRFGVIAECEVECARPWYPLRTARGVFYPVGRFRTTLASPEITEARSRGELVAVGPGWIHDLGYPLARWAQWALGLIDGQEPDLPEVVRMLVKQWGRSVIGKFAARSSRQVDRGPALYPGWRIERGTSGIEHVPAVDVHIGGRHWWEVHDQEGDNSYPAVLAWVESYVRVALNRMLGELGEDLWVCCDTDGAVLDLTKARSWLHGYDARFGRLRGPRAVAEAVCRALEPLTSPLVPRVKMMSESLTVSGPQHYAGDTFERMAGRPGKPEVDADGHLAWWAWPGVRWQMEHGDDGGFVRVEQDWTSPSQLAHRWVLDDGTALPVRARICGPTVSDLAPVATSLSAGLLTRLAPSQAPALTGLF